MFELITRDRNYVFAFPNELEMKIMVEQLQLAIHSLHIDSDYANCTPGWQYNITRSSIYSAVWHGDNVTLRAFLDRAKESSEQTHMLLNTQDELGMFPIHWAALNGHTESLSMLLEVLNIND